MILAAADSWQFDDACGSTAVVGIICGDVVVSILRGRVYPKTGGNNYVNNNVDNGDGMQVVWKR